MTKLRISQQGRPLHRIGDPRDDAARAPPRRRQPVAGIPRLPRPRGDQGRRRARHRRRTSTSTRSPGAHPCCATRSRATSTRRHGVPIDPDTQVTVCCGSTEAMIATLLGLVDPGDEVIVFEPFYENYGPDAILAGAVTRYVTLRGPDWTFDPDELAAAFSDRTRAIIVNTPNNPTGKVFSRDELAVIAGLCRRWDVIAITDEIYEHIVYDGAAPRAADGARRHGGADGGDQQRLEDLQRDGLARRLGGGAARPRGRHPQGARLPDRRRPGAAAAGRRLRARPARRPTSPSSPRTIRRGAIGWWRCSSGPGSAARCRAGPIT